MKMKVSIPATIETKKVIRCFTCYPHQLDSRITVDTVNYTRDVDLPEGVEPEDYSKIMRVLRHWQANKPLHGHVPGENGGTLILAYQIFEVEIVSAHRMHIHHCDYISERDTSTLSEKVFVHAGSHVSLVTKRQFRDDAEWVLGQDKLPSKERSRDGFEERYVSMYTLVTYRELCPDYRKCRHKQFLKLGRATYVPWDASMVYRPDKSLNQPSVIGD